MYDWKQEGADVVATFGHDLTCDRLVAVRIIREGDVWRVDQAASAAGFWLPWEPALSDEFPDQNAARVAAEQWAERSRIRLDRVEVRRDDR